MKLKRWLYPFISVLITIAILGLTVLLIHILDKIIWLCIIVIVLFSNIWFVSHPVLAFIYAYKCLKDCKFKVFFVFYSAILLTLPAICLIFLTKNGIAIPISFIIFNACIITGLVGSISKKQIQQPHEYTAQFENVTMDDPIE